MGAINDAFDAMNSFRDRPRETLRLSMVRAGAAALQQGKKPVPVATWATVHREEGWHFSIALLG
jgi:hypothetical protein